ncbi:hypothetical protein HHK36_028100 [Tetracentron sinense]|uniref:Uncharacterized protein n=1 Tax=Tetracentron sinense TaxID=13715 RepID=A0A834YIN2_TETSI|nr:hypothetical protein HHK36_028100 [Tetracentron sinense]
MQLQHLRKGSSTMVDFINQFKTIVDSLASIQEPVSDKDLVMHALGGLSSKYESFITAVTNQSEAISFTELHARLLMHEQCLLHFQQPNANHPSMAFFGQQQSSQPSFNSLAVTIMALAATTLGVASLAMTINRAVAFLINKVVQLPSSPQSFRPLCSLKWLGISCDFQLSSVVPANLGECACAICLITMGCYASGPYTATHPLRFITTSCHCPPSPSANVATPPSPRLTLVAFIEPSLVVSPDLPAPQPESPAAPTAPAAPASLPPAIDLYVELPIATPTIPNAPHYLTHFQDALNISGPAVFISYIIAGISALLSSLCYTEFSLEIPVAGGAFSYLRVTFGEFMGYFAGANILMEYVLSNVAVARSFTEYMCCAFGGMNPNHGDLNTKESSRLNFVMTVFHVVFFGFDIIAGFCNRNAKNLIRPGGLAPYGVKGVLDGAAIVYFSYIGYDSVSTMAEEIKNPSKILPVGIVGSVLIVSIPYCLMALSLCVIIPYDEISDTASYSLAFQNLVGWNWMSNVVGELEGLGWYHSGWPRSRERVDNGVAGMVKLAGEDGGREKEQEGR